MSLTKPEIGQTAQIISPDEDVYAGRDEGGNLHIHVCGRCFTNSDLVAAIQALDQLFAEAEMVEQAHLNAGQPHYSRGLEMARNARVAVRHAPDICSDD